MRSSDGSRAEVANRRLPGTAGTFHGKQEATELLAEDTSRSGHVFVPAGYCAGDVAGERGARPLDLRPWGRGDFHPVEWAHPEIEYVIADFGPLIGSTRGLAGMAETWSAFLGAWEEYRCEVDESGARRRARPRAPSHHWTGQVEWSGSRAGGTKAANLFHVRGSKVTRLVIWADQERGLAELGLSELDARTDS